MTSNFEFSLSATDQAALEKDKDAVVTYIVTEKADVSPAKVASDLKKAISEDDNLKNLGVALDKNTAGKPVAENLGLGYYFVDSTSGALCNLTSTTPNATIADKNDVPFEKTTEVDITGVQIGDSVPYVITGKVPSTEGFNDYVYEVTDTMGKGLKYNKDVTVTITGVTNATSYYEVSDGTDSGFKVAIKVMELQDYVGADITVNYSATVTEDAEIGAVINNEASLNFGHNGSTTERKNNAKVFTAEVEINKIDGATANDENPIPLANAKFVLQNADGKYYKATEVAVEGEEGVTKVSKVEWVDSIDDATEVTTDNAGKANFIGLKNGWYTLVETKAPDGYNELTEGWRIQVDASYDKESSSILNSTAVARVVNYAGTELPSTGGIGTTIFTVTGAILMIGAAVLFLTKKRSEA